MRKMDRAERIARRLVRYQDESHPAQGNHLTKIGPFVVDVRYIKADADAFRALAIKEIAAALRKAGIKGG